MRIVLVLLVFATVAALPGAQTSPPETLTLANGLRIVLERDTSFPSISVHVLYGVGAVDDPPAQSGLAHLVEHLAFVKTKHIKRLTVMNDLGFRGATNINGETYPETTEFHEMVPKSELEGVLWVESERMGFLAEGIDQDALDNHRAILARETEHRVAFGDSAELSLKRWRALFPAGHPYARRFDEQLENVTLGDVRHFADRYYGPRNAVLVLVGDLPANTGGLIHQYFDDVLPRGEAPVHEPAVTPRGRFDFFWKDVRYHAVRAWAVPGLVAQPRSVTIAATKLVTYSGHKLVDAPSDFMCEAHSESFIGNGELSLHCSTASHTTTAEMARWIDRVMQRASTATRDEDVEAANRATTVELLAERQTFPQRAAEHARRLYFHLGAGDDPGTPVARSTLVKAIAPLAPAVGAP